MPNPKFNPPLTEEQEEMMRTVIRLFEYRSGNLGRPAFCADEHLEYLFELRDSGVTNMFAAAPYLERKFDISHEEATEILCYWMKFVEDRNSNKP